jgi:hypothetical protein
LRRGQFVCSVLQGIVLCCQGDSVQKSCDIGNDFVINWPAQKLSDIRHIFTERDKIGVDDVRPDISQSTRLSVLGKMLKDRVLKDPKVRDRFGQKSIGPRSMSYARKLVMG